MQEGLTNARKHAAGHPVTVTVAGGPGDGLRIELTNSGSNGVPLAPGSGTGLVGLTERVQLAGGTLDHRREPDGGFRLARLATVADMSEPTIRVLVVDDDALVRASLEMMLDGAHGISVVGQAADGDEVPAAIDAHFPDLVLMDLRMPRVDGIVATRRVRARTNPPEVVVLTTFDTDENVLHALRAGASGFLLKDTPPAQIVEAVRRVAAGDPILSPAITRRLMDRRPPRPTRTRSRRSRCSGSHRASTT